MYILVVTYYLFMLLLINTALSPKHINLILFLYIVLLFIKKIFRNKYKVTHKYVYMLILKNHIYNFCVFVFFFKYIIKLLVLAHFFIIIYLFSERSKNNTFIIDFLKPE